MKNKIIAIPLMLTSCAEACLVSAAFSCYTRSWKKSESSSRNEVSSPDTILVVISSWLKEQASAGKFVDFVVHLLSSLTLRSLQTGSNHTIPPRRTNPTLYFRSGADENPSKFIRRLPSCNSNDFLPSFSDLG